ncbi:MAG: hypothetical protein ACK5UC_06475 [Planctomycetaceae bacterium]
MSPGLSSAANAERAAADRSSRLVQIPVVVARCIRREALTAVH